MRILTLLLALFLTLLPDSGSCVSVPSVQDVCFEEVCDVEEDAILRPSRRISEDRTASYEIPLTEHRPVIVPVFQYHPIHLCFERQWLATCALRC